MKYSVAAGKTTNQAGTHQMTKQVRYCFLGGHSFQTVQLPFVLSKPVYLGSRQRSLPAHRSQFTHHSSLATIHTAQDKPHLSTEGWKDTVQEQDALSYHTDFFPSGH